MPPLRRQLRLFPLNVVLFPRATMPLHVFEERYKLMVQRCLDDDSRFGVVLIRSGPEVGGAAEPHAVGTVAHIDRVRGLEDGRMLLAVSGEERFRVEEMLEGEPYPEARVEVLGRDEEGLGEGEEERAREAATRYIRVRQGLKGGWTREPRMPGDPSALSYFIAGVLRIEPLEKQRLLEEDSDRARLLNGTRLLEEHAAELKQRLASELRRRMTGL